MILLFQLIVLPIKPFVLMKLYCYSCYDYYYHNHHFPASLTVSTTSASY